MKDNPLLILKQSLEEHQKTCHGATFWYDNEASFSHWCRELTPEEWQDLKTITTP